MDKKNKKNNTILFVDDHKMCHIFVDFIIPNFTDYELISAFSGKDAVELGKKHRDKIFCVISDIMLPDIDGYEIFDIFDNDDTLGKKPFIFQSGYVEQKEFLEKQLSKRIVILSKPYTQDDLLNAIKEAEEIVKYNEKG